MKRSSLRRTPPAEIYGLDDAWPEIAVVRAKDDDEMFWRLTAGFLREHERYDLRFDASDAEALATAVLHVEPPVWRWHRKNVCSPENRDAFGWAWTLGYPDGPGRGNWRGALVRVRVAVKS